MEYAIFIVAMTLCLVLGYAFGWNQRGHDFEDLIECTKRPKEVRYMLAKAAEFRRYEPLDEDGAGLFWRILTWIREPRQAAFGLILVFIAGVLWFANR